MHEQETRTFLLRSVWRNRDDPHVLLSPCRTCVGKGWVPGLLYGERTCRKCAGEGTQILSCSESCELCDGRGYLMKMREEGSGAEVPAPTVAYEKAGSGS